jgi:hypothetical protein
VSDINVSVIVDTSSLDSEWARALDEFSEDMALATETAASDAAKDIHENHPWTDRTSKLTQSLEGVLVERSRLHAVSEVRAGPEPDEKVKEPYASFVDDWAGGEVTRRMEETAERSLHQELDYAADKLAARMNR